MRDQDKFNQEANGMTYTRINGTYTQRMPWGERITATNKDDLGRLVMQANRREQQRQAIVRKLGVK